MNLDWHAERSDLPDLALLDQVAVQEPIDLAAVRSYRLARVREQMAAHQLEACVLLDPVNVRYATGARNMQVFHARNPARYLFVPQSGPVVLHEFAGCAHLAEGLETIDEIRRTTLWVESYIGEERGNEGVKLERQLLVTEDEPELLSTFPFEAALLDQPA